MIEIASATRLPEGDFWNKSALGISLRRMGSDKRLVGRVSFSNRRGIPEIYNARISAGEDDGILVFVHDDVWIDDYFLADRVIEGLREYDVIGVAGNRRRVERQPAWAFPDTRFVWDDPANLSGSIAHGKTPFGRISSFGAVPADCELLDGVFLAARKAALRAKGVCFDPQFDFHFYDMDFCRSARHRGLRLGTWPICLTHQSEGGFDTEPWNEKYRAYLEKWGG
jgi:GT2 family glycosyltransferase